MIEAEHPEICKADEVIADTQRILRDLEVAKAEERKRIVAVCKAMQREKLKSHQVHELMFIKGKGYEPVPIPQYERQ